MGIDELKGQTIREVTIVKDEDDGDGIIFKTAEFIFTYAVESECCSHSWIEHMEDLRNIINQEIIDVIEYPEVDSDGKDDDCLTVYRTELKSKIGSAILEYRNESNGYYGGYLELRSKEILNDMVNILAHNS